MSTAPTKRDTALFFITELRYDSASRKDIIEVLMDQLQCGKANAAYYVDRAFK